VEAREITVVSADRLVILSEPAVPQKPGPLRIAVICAGDVDGRSGAWKLVISLLQLHVSVGDVYRFADSSYRSPNPGVAQHTTIVFSIVLTDNGEGDGGRGASTAAVADPIDKTVRTGVVERLRQVMKESRIAGLTKNAVLRVGNVALDVEVVMVRI